MTEYEIFVVIVFFGVEFSSWESCRTNLSAYNLYGPTISRLLEMAHGKTHFVKGPRVILMHTLKLDSHCYRNQFVSVVERRLKSIQVIDYR